MALLAVELRATARGDRLGGPLWLSFVFLLLLRGKLASGGRSSLLRCTWRVRCKPNSRREQACDEKRQTRFIGHGRSSLFLLIRCSRCVRDRSVGWDGGIAAYANNQHRRIVNAKDL